VKVSFQAPELAPLGFQLLFEAMRIERPKNLISYIFVFLRGS
jgi:hypothetical protein